MAKQKQEAGQLPTTQHTIAQLKNDLEKERAYSKMLELNFDAEVEKRMTQSILDQIDSGIGAGIAAEFLRMKTQFNDEVESRVESRLLGSTIGEKFDCQFDPEEDYNG